ASRTPSPARRNRISCPGGAGSRGVRVAVMSSATNGVDPTDATPDRKTHHGKATTTGVPRGQRPPSSSLRLGGATECTDSHVLFNSYVLFGGGCPSGSRSV